MGTHLTQSMYIKEINITNVVNGYFAGRWVRVTTCGYRFAGRGPMLAGQSQICAGHLEIA